LRHNAAVSAILYPIAASASEALTAPRGRAARERDAEMLAFEPVRFVREFVGPVFETEDQARDAYPGRLDDERPETRASLAPEDRFCQLKPIARRGAEATGSGPTVWRLSIGYWKIGGDEAAAAAPDLVQARQTRRDTKAQAPDAETLGTLTHQPLRPIRPQKALDFGLFEVRMPEDLDRLMPDE
jgi:hypothetical protein